MIFSRCRDQRLKGCSFHKCRLPLTTHSLTNISLPKATQKITLMGKFLMIVSWRRLRMRMMLSHLRTKLYCVKEQVSIFWVQVQWYQFFNLNLILCSTRSCCSLFFYGRVGHCAVGSIVGASNAKVASLIGADMVLIANGGLVSSNQNNSIKDIVHSQMQILSCGTSND